MDRISKVISQLKLNSNISINSVKNLQKKDPNDILIVECKRTALCRSRRGGFKDTLAVDLLVPVVKEVIKNINPKIVSDVVVGNVLAIGTHRHIECRMAAGLESMTIDGKFMKQPFIIGNSVKKEKLARDALIPMGITSENV